MFARQTGFLEHLKTKRIKSIVDYVMGVEVGLDTNGRKNRGGAAMESLIEWFVNTICQRKNLQYLPQATASKIRQKWNLNLPVNRSERTVDFAVRRGDHLILIETNFYGGGGSKLKATAGEYKAIFDFWRGAGCGFIWITDGKGWKSARLPLEEDFNHIDYILNLEMTAKGLLEDLLTHSCETI